jgi:histidine triad (HIT) family protein
MGLARVTRWSGDGRLLRDGPSQRTPKETPVPDCIFCQIVAGKIAAKKVGETTHVYAFRDNNPQAPTHILLIPKEHVADSAADLGPQHAIMLTELFGLAAKIARDERLELGWRLVTNVGPEAGQSVYHLHVHLLGGRSLRWPPG